MRLVTQLPCCLRCIAPGYLLTLVGTVSTLDTSLILTNTSKPRSTTSISENLAFTFSYTIAGKETQTFVYNEPGSVYTTTYGEPAISVASGKTQTVSTISITQTETGISAVPFTITGPTTFITTGLANFDALPVIQEGPNATADARCKATASLPAARAVTYALYQTYSFWSHVYTIDGPTGIYTTSTTVQLPTLSVTTVTTVLAPAPDTDPMGALPGQLCNGLCGGCQIYFPTVNVFYFPVESPNTACMSNNGSIGATSGPVLASRGYAARPSVLPRGVSTVVTDGFTLYVTLQTLSSSS